MKISEAIKFIVDQNDKKLLTDSKRFKSYLLDLCSDNQKELKIVKRALEDKILERIFGNERDNVKIARLRDEFEDQGMSEDWSEFVISSFAEALSWNYTPKVQNQQVQSQPQQKQQTNQEQNQPSNQTNWTCSCGFINTTKFCGNCGKSKLIPKNASWTCSCGFVNTTKFCGNCGKTEQEAEEARLKSEEEARKKAEEARRRAEEEVRKRVNLLKNFNIGDYVKFGCYPQSADGDFKPIEWQVLAKENNKMLVISKYGLETRRFDRTSNNWENSEIRKWLNGDFYYKAFSENEKKLIRNSNISTTVYEKKKKSGIFGSLLGQEETVEFNELTYDKVFLLSKEEAEKYFANYDARKCKPTEYAKANGAYIYDGYGYWWLRSPNPDVSNYVYGVGFGGFYNYYGVFSDDVVACPALWINL